MMKKLFAGLLSLITMGAMLFASIPTAIHAVNETATPTTDTVSIVSEDVSKRGMYEKHFLMSDGSYTVTVYDEPVHQDVNGTWIEVDNTLQLTTNTKGVSQYKTVNGITDVSFAKQFDSELVTMKQGDYSLSWDITAVPGNSNHISIIETFTKVDAQIMPLDLSGLSEEEVKTVATKSTSTVRYNDALAQGVDVEYIVTPSKVKENIILDSPKDITGYLITLYTENLSARLLENNQIELYNTLGEVVFTLHSPYMYDSAGELSENFNLLLLPKGTGRYILAMEPDAEWLSDPDRVYPVVIDPAASPSNATSNIIDNYVREDHGVQNNNLDRLYIGKISGYKNRAYIKYKKMPYIPSGSSIRSATMQLTMLPGASQTYYISAYRVTGGDWASGEITWANMPTAGNVFASYVEPSEGKYSFSCLSAVQYWYEGNGIGRNANYGVMVRLFDETINDSTAVYSAEVTGAASRPTLTINYMPPIPIVLDIVWPAPGKYFITSRWGFRYSSDRVHAGIDISCSEGTELVAAIDGTVQRDWDKSAGNMLIITSIITNLQVRYYHLKDNGYLVNTGDTVITGMPVAKSGNTGESTGPHLHFQVQNGDNEQELFNPLVDYNDNDTRYDWINPNPMYIKSGEAYVPNPNFNYVYTASDYNDIGPEWERPREE